VTAQAIEPTALAGVHDAHPRLGYVQVAVAAVLFGVNASVSKVVLDAGIEPRQLASLRCTGAAVGLLGALAVLSPARLRVPRRSLPHLALLGVVGAALIQWFYFEAIDRLPVGIAILLEFTGPVLVAVYARVIQRQRVQRGVWAALGLSLAGLALVSEVWSDARLDALGVAAGVGAACCLAAFLLLGRHSSGATDPVASAFWMFTFASAFWLVVEPWWRVDGSVLADAASLSGRLAGVDVPVWLALGWVIVLGTLVPYALDLAALHHLPAATVGAVGMLEPVVATAVAWAWLEQTLGPLQVLGAIVVLGGVALAEHGDPAAVSDPGAAPLLAGAASLPSMSIYDVSINALDGSPADLRGYDDKAVLLVNVASRCGLTPQYTGLEEIHERFADRGFTVLGVPCNQFGEQEPGSAEEIATFCSTSYGVTFPMTEKIEVNGEGRHELYQQLVEVPDAGDGHTGDIRWNFEKFLIAPGGKVVGRFNPMVEPTSDQVVDAIEDALPATS
jgi:glutathione peroxidase-family protein/drug/metabolite transporter (DMT)-like permease